MTWNNAIKRATEELSAPMHQVTHWALFLACGLTYMFKTIEWAAAASYDMILKNPEIATGSWLVGGIF